MSDQSTFSLLVAIRYFGWGPVRKVSPPHGCLPTLGVRAAAQVARLITQTISAPHKLP